MFTNLYTPFHSVPISRKKQLENFAEVQIKYCLSVHSTDPLFCLRIPLEGWPLQKSLHFSQFIDSLFVTFTYPLSPLSFMYCSVLMIHLTSGLPTTLPSIINPLHTIMIHYLITCSDHLNEFNFTHSTTLHYTFHSRIHIASPVHPFSIAPSHLVKPHAFLK